MIENKCNSWFSIHIHQLDKYFTWQTQYQPEQSEQIQSFTAFTLFSMLFTPIGPIIHMISHGNEEHRESACTCTLSHCSLFEPNMDYCQQLASTLDIRSCPSSCVKEPCFRFVYVCLLLDGFFRSAIGNIVLKRKGRRSWIGSRADYKICHKKVGLGNTAVEVSAAWLSEQLDSVFPTVFREGNSHFTFGDIVACQVNEKPVKPIDERQI